MKIFISWSGYSKDLALAIHKFIPDASMNVLETWVSADTKCLPHGPGFPAKILKAVDDCDACLAILTEQSIKNWWVNFEAGTFYGKGKPVFGLLCGDVSHEHLQGRGHPLGANGTAFTSPTAKSLSDLFISILNGNYGAVGRKAPSSEQIVRNIDACFGEFHSAYQAMIASPDRSISEMVGEIDED